MAKVLDSRLATVKQRALDWVTVLAPEPTLRCVQMFPLELMFQCDLPSADLLRMESSEQPRSPSAANNKKRQMQSTSGVSECVALKNLRGLRKTGFSENQLLSFRERGNLTRVVKAHVSSRKFPTPTVSLSVELGPVRMMKMIILNRSVLSDARASLKTRCY
jgi:hypothetical protein